MSQSCLQYYEHSNDVNGGDPEPLSQDGEIPVKNRKKTDLIYFVVLILFFIFLVISVIVAGSQGDIRRLTHGYDDKGNMCGLRNKLIEGIDGSGMDFTQEKYLLLKKHCKNDEDCWTERLCVEECQYGLIRSSIIPQCATDADDMKPNATLKPTFEIVISDLSFCWKEIIELCLLSIFLSGVTLAILPMFPRTAIWILFITICVAVIIFAILAWRLCIMMFLINTKSYDETEKNLWAQKTTYTLVSLIVGTVLSVMCVLLPCCVKPEVKLIPIVLEEGSKCIRDVPMILLQPVLTHVINAVFTCFMVFGIFCCMTSGTAELDSEGKVSFKNNMFFQIATWVLIFTLFWVSQFFLACQNLAIAGTASMWYFSRIKGQLINPVWRSICIVVKHHLGSAALGSLSISMIRPFQFLYRMTQGRDATTVIEPIDKFDYAMCFLRVISKNAYVMIALFGDPFFASARRAFTSVISETPSVGYLLGTKAAVLVIVEFFIAMCVTFVGESLIMDIEEIQIFWIPSCAFFFSSLFCCHVFFSIYNMAIDAIILCFCVDHQMNDGIEKPYYMDEKLKVLFNKFDSSTTGNEIHSDVPLASV